MLFVLDVAVARLVDDEGLVVVHVEVVDLVVVVRGVAILLVRAVAEGAGEEVAVRFGAVGEETVDAADLGVVGVADLHGGDGGG